MGKWKHTIIERLMKSSTVEQLVNHYVREQSGLYPIAGIPPVTAQPSPYALNNDASDQGLDHHNTLFITARFRTGSTWLWNMFCVQPSYTAYYEPLNEQRWFNQPPTAVDPTHYGAQSYTANYEKVGALDPLFTEDWSYKRLYMDRRQDDPNLRTYIKALVAAAPNYPVLQFNRVDFRLDWLKSHFPSARILHLYRHPRAQWQSALGKGVTVPATVTLRDFAPYDRFYLRAWWRDLSKIFPFLGPMEHQHPYTAFYALWLLSYSFGKSYADYSVGYETLRDHPIDEMGAITEALDLPALDPDLLMSVTRSTPRPDHTTDQNDQFTEIETACDRLVEIALNSSGLNDR